MTWMLNFYLPMLLESPCIIESEMVCSGNLHVLPFFYALEASEFGLGYSYPDSFECLVKGDKANVDVSNTFGYFKD